MDMIEVHYVHTARHKLTRVWARAMCAASVHTALARRTCAGFGHHEERVVAGSTDRHSWSANADCQRARHHGPVHAFSHRGTV